MTRRLVTAVSVMLMSMTSTSLAQVTSPVLPGPGNAMPAVMTYGAASRQTVTIIGDNKIFPPVVYARMTDTIEFNNQTDSIQSITATDGTWTTGDIAPGTSVEMTYVDIRGLGNSLNEPNCTGWVASDTRANGRADPCASHREFALDSGGTSVVTNAIVHVTLAGTMSNQEEWNVYDKVPAN